MSRKWYLLYTKPRQERTTSWHLQRKGLLSLLPMIWNPLLPNYLFLHLHPRSPSLPEKVKCERGQAVVEFTFAALLFFSLIFAIVEFSHLLYTRLNAQHALREAGRYMVTGQGFDPGDSTARGNVIHDKFCQSLIGTGVSCPPVGPDFRFTCGVAACSTPGGNPGQTVTVTATLTKPWFTGLFGSPITFTLNTTWKNEPYLTS